ncbi:MAG: low-specificity L-threonine aldolase, partial [Burkholderiales bacterium]|nr:low-specificity L-threonine aldolase [Burkholderiales bacterium]
YPALTLSMPDTNIIFVNVAEHIAPAFSAHLAEHGIGITSAYGATQQRWVTHLDISRQAVEETLSVVERFFAQR